MTPGDLFTLTQLRAHLAHVAGAAIYDDDHELVADKAECREFATVLEIALSELAELDMLRGIAHDAIEDSVMYQRGIVEGRRQGLEERYKS